MLSRMLLITAAAVAIFGLTAPRSASALSCIPLGDVVARMDLIVRGSITAIPSNGVVELSVSRYYKGDAGPALLRAEVPGLGQGQRMDWHNIPKVGDELIIGFVRRSDALVNEACNLFVQLQPGQKPPQEVTNYIGDGVAPVGGAETGPAQGRDQPRNTPLWAPGVGVLVIGLGAWTVWRWRRRAAGS